MAEPTLDLPPAYFESVTGPPTPVHYATEESVYHDHISSGNLVTTVKIKEKQGTPKLQGSVTGMSQVLRWQGLHKSDFHTCEEEHMSKIL